MNLETLECPICLDRFDDPRILITCGHSVCFKCISQLYKDGGVMCPFDRAITTASSLDGFKVNFALRDVIEMLKASNLSSSLQNSVKSCGFCSEVAVKFCSHCEGFLCTVHLEAHQSNIFTAKHNPIEPQNVPPNCSKHPKEFVQLYCNTCRTLVCSLCVPLQHQNHAFVLIEEASAAVWC